MAGYSLGDVEERIKLPTGNGNVDNPEEEMRPLKEIRQKIPASSISTSQPENRKESNTETADDIGRRDEERRTTVRVEDSSRPARRQVNERRMEARDPLRRDPLRREENNEKVEGVIPVNEGRAEVDVVSSPKGSLFQIEVLRKSVDKQQDMRRSLQSVNKHGARGGGRNGR
jgi:hypothetical protein